MRQLTEIILHCSATPPQWFEHRTAAEKVIEIRNWHMAHPKNWSDIGYHYVIDRDGTVVDGRPLARTGAHVIGHNRGTIGVCLIGGHGSSENDAPNEHFTPQQLASARLLIDSLKGRYPTIKKVTGHNQYAAKACPGFNVPRWLEHKTAERDSPMQSSTLQATAATATAGATAFATVFGALSPTAQAIVLVCAGVALFGLAWVARERLQRWARGDR